MEIRDGALGGSTLGNSFAGVFKRGAFMGLLLCPQNSFFSCIGLKGLVNCAFQVNAVNAPEKTCSFYLMFVARILFQKSQTLHNTQTKLILFLKAVPRVTDQLLKAEDKSVKAHHTPAST